MKLQSLAVIFIIIILPISLILTAYIQNQVETLRLQTSYDLKLNNATYDALKAFQLNTINSGTSDLSNSKLRDIEASVNTFYDSIASNFNMDGYNKDILKEYVPALVYTMYDGYYIYTPYTNTLDTTNKNEIVKNDGNKEYKSDSEILSLDKNEVTFKHGEKLSGLKPYIYYSCRYVKGDIDVVITYSLDNYITVRGKIGTEIVNRSGYLIDFEEDDDVNPDDGMITYKGVKINTENLYEYVDANYSKQYQYKKINGVKYYKEQDTDKCFSILNGKKYYQDINVSSEEMKSKAAVNYYAEAAVFTNWVREKLWDLSTLDAVDENGNKLEYKFGNFSIFGIDSEISIEEPNSNFNQHRLAVIRYSIEKNLSIAIANYNNYLNSTNYFLMPELKENEWDKILNNISIISFLQGLNIGGKVYNGYSIINNTKNQEVVTEESIYIATSNAIYHKVTEEGLKDKPLIRGILNIDFERKIYKDPDDGTSKYFFSRTEIGSYDSIVSQTKVINADNIYEYLEGDEKLTLASKYYTALGRERYSMYRTNNNASELLKNFKNN